MDARASNFRIILALTSFPQDISLNGTSLKVTVGNATKTIPLTTKEATPLDFSGIQPGSKVEFGLEDAEGFMFGYSELRVPNVAFDKNETEVNEHLRFYLIDKEKDSFVASVYAIFLNKGLFKEKKGEKSPAPKARAISPLKQSIERQSSRSPNGSTGRSSPTKQGSQKQLQEAKKQEEKNFQAYLNRLVDNHSSHLKNLVDEHNSVNDYIHMNKMHNNLPNSFANDTLENYHPIKLDGSSKMNKSHYNSSSVNDLVDAHNKSLSSSGNFRVARFGNEGEISRTQSQVLKDLSPMEKKISSITNDLGTPIKRQGSTSPLHSPLKKGMTMERGNSSVSNYLNSSSPLNKRQSVADASFELGRREIPDAAYYKAQLTNLNNVIINQNAKLADMEVTKRENESLRGDLQRSEGARKALQESIQETTNELKTANRELERQLSNQILERETLLRKNNELQSAVQELTNGLAAAKASLQERDDVIAQQMLKLAELDELRMRQKKLQEAIVVADKQRARDQENYKASLAQVDQSLQETRKVVENLTQEKKRILHDLNKANEEINNEKASHVASQNEMVLLKKKLENAENLKQVVASLESQRDQLNSQLSEARASMADQEALFRDVEDKMANRMRECENKEREFAREASSMREKVLNADQRCEKMNKEISEQKLKVVQLNTTISSLEQLICVKEDISRQLETAEKQLDQVMEDRKVLRTQLETLATNQEQTSNRLLEVERQSNQLRAMIDEKDEQIEHLTWTVANLREGQEMYIPLKGDFIDNTIADYINTSDEVSRLKLLFIREGEGVYQFGTKRVYIKVEGGKILIRVGGGFLSIDEFIDQYAPLEFEKFVRNDPLKKLTKNIAVNKTLIGKMVNQMEKPKNQAYEYRNEADGIRVMNGSPLGRKNSRAGY